jgi:hypothetical protein
VFAAVVAWSPPLSTTGIVLAFLIVSTFCVSPFASTVAAAPVVAVVNDGAALGNCVVKCALASDAPLADPVIPFASVVVAGSNVAL